MSVAIQKLRTDDIDGSPGAERIIIEVDGTRCQIDLGTANRKMLQEALSPYFEAGKVTAVTAKRTDIPAVKKWATQNGYEVPVRGRIPTAVLEAYDEHHPK